VKRALLAAAVLFAANAANASGEPGRFDYWLLTLTWSPQFCSAHVGDPQCLNGRYNFLVHGLWPQYDPEGYPDYCQKVDSLDRALVDRMLPLMPDPKLVTQEWRKHGSCSGLSASEYFLNVERARLAIAIPEDYQDPEKYVKTSAQEITDKFIAVNPGLTRTAITLECSGHWLKEARICFDRNFKFRTCGIDVAGDCGEGVTVRPNRAGH
jgi:ribonuclease T2